MIRIRNAHARFFGEIQDSFPHGYGIMYTEAFTYDGYFYHGRFHGIGSLNVRGKYYYRGNFVSGYFQNHGYLIKYGENVEYEGQFMTGRMNGFGRLITDEFTFEGYLANNAMQLGLYQEKQRSTKFLGTFEHNQPKSGTLWAVIGGQQIKLYTAFDKYMVPGQQGLITTRRNYIFYDGWRCTRHLDAFLFLAGLFGANSSEQIDINCKKTYARYSSYYVGSTRNLVPDGEGILYINSCNCFVGVFKHGSFVSGSLEFRMGRYMFVSKGNRAVLGRKRLHWLDASEQQGFCERSKRDYASKRIIIDFENTSTGLKFEGEVQDNKAAGYCILRIQSSFLQAEFARGLLHGPSVLQYNAVFYVGDYTNGRREGVFQVINRYFVYYYFYSVDVLYKYALVDTKTRDFAIYDSSTQRGVLGVQGAVRAAIRRTSGEKLGFEALVCVSYGRVYRRVFSAVAYKYLLEMVYSARAEHIALHAGAWVYVKPQDAPRETRVCVK